MIQLSSAEVELLKSLYIKFDTPVDGFIDKREELESLVDEFNDQVSGSLTPNQALRFMMNQRKRSLWPRIRRNYQGRNVKRVS